MWTDKQVKGFKPRTARYRASENANKRGAGRLVLDVLPSGQRDFYFQYFRDGQRRYVKIGSFKQSDKDTGFTLAEAREKALQFADIQKQGFDVKRFLDERRMQEDERIRALESRKRQGSFAQLLESYLTAMQTKGRRSVYYVRKSFDRYVTKPFPELVSKKASEITSKDIHLILRRMLDAGITTQTNRLRSYLHAAFKHGITQDIDPRRYAAEGVMFNVSANPVSSVPRQADFERTGEHVISETEIPVIWKQLPKKSLVAGAVINLAFATGQRVGELVRLKRGDFDLNERLMLIPGAVSKNGIDHMIPLNELAFETVSQLFEQVTGSQFAFPGLRRGKYRDDAHINSTTVAHVASEFCEETKTMSKFVPRDIRRTVKTLMGKAGISKELRDRIQNHAMQDVSTKHYDRYDYLAEKRHGLTVWNDSLRLILNPQPNVTNIRRKSF